VVETGEEKGRKVDGFVVEEVGGFGFGTLLDCALFSSISSCRLC
jgi:hypothetical protein